MKETKEKKIAKKKTAKKPVEKGLTIPVIDLNGENVGSIDWQEEIGQISESDGLLAQFVHSYRANQRQGTHSTKTRSEVNASTRKIYRQKGTGRARHGSKKAPIFVGGGVTFGPKPRDYRLKLNKKQRQKAFKYAMNKKIKDGMVFSVMGLLKIEPKTKKIADFLQKINVNSAKNWLVVYPREGSVNLIRATKNIGNVGLRSASIVNAYDLLRFERIIISREAVDELKKIRFSD